MIPKLRRKFVLINMCLVSVVLVVVFIAIGLTTYERTKDESMIAMDRLLSRAANDNPRFMEIGGGKKPDRDGPLVPVFSALLDENQQVAQVTRENVSVSDEVVAELVSRVQATGKLSGAFWNDELRFMFRDTPEGTKIAFADMNREIETLVNLLIVLLLVGVGALAAFFGISLYLAHWALRPVEQAWEKQKRFVADASHELRTPLTVILANTGILLSHKEDKIADQAKWVEYTQTETLRMKKLVDDLLFLAKADAPHKPAIKSAVNLSDALWSCVLPFESVAYESGVTIETDIQTDLMQQGDEGQLKQLAVILIDNACKYAGPGGKVSVLLGRLKDRTVLRVNNTGTPIPETDLLHVFDRFYRVDSARTRDQGGYGLGLSIAHAIVENHGGTISVRSGENEGTTFEVQL